MGLETRVAELRRYVDFGDEDAKCLGAIHDLLAPDFARLATAFYDKIREHEEAHVVLKNEEQIARLHRALQAWMSRLLGGTYDDAYYQQVERVGDVHVRVGLPQHYMFTAMALIRVELEKLIEARVPHDQVARTNAALNKAIDVELAIMIEAYREAHIARLERRQDIERESLATSLAQTERRYATAIELTRELVIVLDTGGMIRLFNAGAEAATGYGREEVVERVFADVLLADESRAPFYHLLEEGSERSHVDALIQTRSGKVRDVRFEIARALHTGEVLLIGHDDTEEKALVARTHQTEKLAAVGTLAAGLAHEIRNPLNGAQLHLAYLERTLKKQSANADTLEAVAVVGDEIKWLAALVTEFLDFARPKPLTKITTALSALVERTAQLVEGEGRQHGVLILRDLPTKDIVAEVDPAKVEQVILNVARNAIEALAPMQTGHVTLRLRRAPKFAVIEVEDDGPGLPGDDAPIFDAFYTTKPQGTGLGLAITHRIITDHGGSIDVDSRPGRTVFRVELPLTETTRGNA